jgi:hypothetical protein
MLELLKGEAVTIDFKDEPDTVAFYGDSKRLPTKLEALDYYMDVSEVQKAVEVYRKLPEDVRGELTPEEFEKEQFLEKHLEEYLEKTPRQDRTRTENSWSAVQNRGGAYRSICASDEWRPRRYRAEEG